MWYRGVTDGQTDKRVDVNLACERIKNNMKPQLGIYQSQTFQNAFHKFGQKQKNNISRS